MISTFLVKNHVNTRENQRAVAWEKAFISLLKQEAATNPNLTLHFSSESSVRLELDRESTCGAARPWGMDGRGPC